MNMSENIGLIDLSFVLYNNAFGAMNRYKSDIGMDRITGNLNEYDWSKDDEFMKILKTYFINCVKRFKAEFNIDYPNMVFAKDCSKTDIWRVGIYPAYKAHRRLIDADKPSFGTAFKAIEKDIIVNLVKKIGVKFVKYPCAEGDDIIAVLKDTIRQQTDKKIYIISSDHDLYQIMDDNTVFYNLRDQKKLSDINVKEELFVKVCIGDRSDNIPNIHVRCGEAAAKKYFNNTELLKEKLKDATIKKQFILNKKLVMFENIPSDIREGIIQEFNKQNAVQTES